MVHVWQSWCQLEVCGKGCLHIDVAFLNLEVMTSGNNEERDANDNVGKHQLQILRTGVHFCLLLYCPVAIMIMDVPHEARLHMNQPAIISPSLTINYPMEWLVVNPLIGGLFPW